MKEPKMFEKWTTWKSGFFMTVQMTICIFLLVLLGHIALTLAVSYHLFKDDILTIWNDLSVKNMINIIMGFNARYENFIIDTEIKPLSVKVLLVFLATSPIWFFFPGVLAYFKKGARKMQSTKHIRGSKLKDEETVAREMSEAMKSVRMPIGCSLMLPVELETHNIGIFGRIGSGKSTQITRIFLVARAQKKKTIVYDPHGEYTSKFMRQEDILFNPFDKRMNINWNIFNELDTVMDFDNIAASLIPEPAGKQDPFWIYSARTVFSAILHLCWQRNEKKNKDIWKYVVMSREELHKALHSISRGRAGASLIEESNRKTESVLSVMRTYCRVFELLRDDNNGEPFSLRKWIKDEAINNTIFVTNNMQYSETLRPILTLFFDVVASSIVSDLSEDFDRRIFILMDEFATLNKLTNLARMLPQGRKFGAVIALGAQEKGPIDKIYGKEIADSILNIFTTKIVFSISDADTAEYFSRLIGEEEIEEAVKNQTWSVSRNRDGGSISSQKRIEKTVLASELTDLKNLECYIKITGYGLTKSKLQYTDYPKINEAFVLRDDLSLSFIDSDKEDFKKMLDRLYMSSEEKRRMGDKWNDHDSGLYDSSDVL
jgi:type IV conjugative transfer system coupling protein TraD